MAAIFIYLLAPLAGIILGTLLMLIILGILSFLRGSWLKRRAPIDKEKLLDPGRPAKQDIKEVEKNRKEEIEKIREFEKLRRDGERQEDKISRNGINPKPNIGRIEETTDIPVKDDNNTRKNRKRVKLHKPSTT